MQRCLFTMEIKAHENQFSCANRLPNPTAGCDYGALVYLIKAAAPVGSEWIEQKSNL